MKNVTTILILAMFAALAQQQPGQRTGPCNLVDPATKKPVTCPSSAIAPQVAGTVTLSFTADQMTALESMRVDILKQSTGTGGVSFAPVYATVTDLIDALVRAKNGILDRAIKQYAPPAVKASQAQADATAEKLRKDQDAALARPEKK